MPSFELIYEDEEDVMEVTFTLFDEHFARAIPLNDNITLHTDLMLTTAWGLSFYSYGQLLQVSETHLDGLNGLQEADRARLIALVKSPPASHFLQLLDADGLRALVKAPTLEDLLRG